MENGQKNTLTNYIKQNNSKSQLKHTFKVKTKLIQNARIMQSVKTWNLKLAMYALEIERYKNVRKPCKCENTAIELEKQKNASHYISIVFLTAICIRRIRW